jgi:hypothetical protein
MSTTRLTGSLDVLHDPIHETMALFKIHPSIDLDFGDPEATPMRASVTASYIARRDDAGAIPAGSM